MTSPMVSRSAVADSLGLSWMNATYSPYSHRMCVVAPKPTVRAATFQRGRPRYRSANPNAVTQGIHVITCMGSSRHVISS